MKNNIINLLFLAVFVLIGFKSQAQGTDCNYIIEQAKAAYQSGNIEEVEEILGNCPTRSYLPKTKRLEALVLITETLIHLKEMKKADSTFLLLLKINPSFELDSFALSPELERMGKTFRTRPIFNIGVNGGTNITLVRTLQSFSPDYNINDLEAPSISVSPGYRGGLDFDFPLGKFFQLSTGVDFSTRGYSYTDNLVNSRLDGGSQIYGSLEFKENQLWIDAPLLLRFVIPTEKIKPYFYLGGHANFLLSSQFTNLQRNFGEGLTAEKSLPIFELADKENGLRAANNFSLTGGMGLMIPVGLDYLTFDLQYNYQISNAVNRKNRYTNPTLLYQFTYVDDDFALSDLAFTVGFSKSIYKPRKKKSSPYQYRISNSEEVRKEKQEKQEKDAKKLQKEFLKKRKEQKKAAAKQKKAERIEAKLQAKEAAAKQKEAAIQAEKDKIIKGTKPRNK